MRNVPASSVREVQQVCVRKRSFINKASLIKRVKLGLNTSRKAVNNSPQENLNAINSDANLF